jgi:hypothetical protein
MAAQHRILFFLMRSSTRYTDSGDEMDCDGVIGETGVDDSDWVYSIVVEISQIVRGTLASVIRAGPILHETVPEKIICSCFLTK